MAFDYTELELIAEELIGEFGRTVKLVPTPATPLFDAARPWRGATSSQGEFWHDSDWTYRKSIGIAAANVSANLTNFPLLVSVVDTDLRDNAQASGNDILFTDFDGLTKLDHEIESYDSVTGTLVAWVRVPALSSTVDNFIYMYYGNAGAADQQNVNGTWDSDFEIVWHLSEDPSGGAPQVMDSTDHDIDGTSSGAMASDDLVDGQINKGLDFNGTNQYITAEATATSIPTTSTVSAWVNVDEGAALKQVANYYTPSTNDGFGFTINGTALQLTFGGVATYNFTGLDPIVVDTWNHVAVTMSGDGGTATPYLNGVPGTPLSIGTRLGSPTIMRMGALFNASRDMIGTVDEFRFESVSRSAAWMAASYANQNNPATFHTVGAAETEAFDPISPTLPAVFMPLGKTQDILGESIRLDEASLQKGVFSAFIIDGKSVTDLGLNLFIYDFVQDESDVFKIVGVSELRPGATKLLYYIIVER